MDQIFMFIMENIRLQNIRNIGHEVSGEITEFGKKCHRVSCGTEGDDRAFRYIVDIAIHVVMESIISVRN